jgi:hypothetical protein
MCPISHVHSPCRVTTSTSRTVAAVTSRQTASIHQRHPPQAPRRRRAAFRDHRVGALRAAPVRVCVLRMLARQGHLRCADDILFKHRRRGCLIYGGGAPDAPRAGRRGRGRRARGSWRDRLPRPATRRRRRGGLSRRAALVDGSDVGGRTEGGARRNWSRADGAQPLGRQRAVW